MPALTGAQLVPLGPWTHSDFNCSSPRYGMDPLGRFAIACERNPYETGVLQLFDADGRRVGPEVVFGRTEPVSEIFVNAVAADGSGSFLVVWRSAHPTSNATRDISVQFFDAMGARLSRTFQLTEGVVGFATGISGVARNRQGDAVVVWTSLDVADDRWFIRGQRFDAGNRPVGDVFTVRVGARGGKLLATSADIDDAGRFVVIWNELPPNQNPGARRLVFQRYARNASPRGKSRGVTADRADFHGSAATVAKEPTGEFVVVWRRQEGIAEGGTLLYRIKARWFDPFGRALTPEVEVSGLANVDGPSLARDRFGNTVIAWAEADHPNGPRYFLRARLFDRLGEPFGDVLDLEQEGPKAQLAIDDDGNLLVAAGTVFRRYQLTCAPGYEARCP